MNVRFKEKGKLDPELFSKKAKECAKIVFNERNTNDKANKPTQIRKFYDEVLRIDGVLKSLPLEEQVKEFENMLPYLKMLNAKAAYHMGRDLITKEFKDFISQSLDQITTKEDFDIFVSLFEAFMGFYKYYDKKGERP